MDRLDNMETSREAPQPRTLFPGEESDDNSRQVRQKLSVKRRAEGQRPEQASFRGTPESKYSFSLENQQHVYTDAQVATLSAKFEEQLKELTGQLSDKLNTSELNTKRELEKFQHDLDQFRDQYKQRMNDLDSRISTCEINMAELTSELKSLSTKSSATDDAFSKVIKNNVGVSARLEAAEKAAREATISKGAWAVYTQQTKDIDERLKTTASEVADISERVKEGKEGAKSLGSRLDAFRKQLESLRSERDSSHNNKGASSSSDDSGGNGGSTSASGSLPDGDRAATGNGRPSCGVDDAAVAAVSKLAESVESNTARIATVEERLNDWERGRTAVPAAETSRRSSDTAVGAGRNGQSAEPAGAPKPREQQRQQQKQQRQQQQQQQQPKPKPAAKAPKQAAAAKGPPIGAPKATASQKGQDAAVSTTASGRPRPQKDTPSSTDGHIDRGALIVDGLPAEWAHDEVLRQIQQRVKQLTGLKVGYSDCTVEAHPTIATRSSKRTTQRVRLSAPNQAAYRALYSIRNQLGLDPGTEGEGESFPKVRVTLALTASGESYKRGYQDVFRHLANGKRSPSWRGTHLMALAEPGGTAWARVDVASLAAELRQQNASNK